MPKKSKTLCVDDLRHAEYYGMQGTFDELYQKSQNGEVFENLMDLILSRDNILLAYRNIKANKGSYTAGTDKKNIPLKRLQQFLNVPDSPLPQGEKRYCPTGGKNLTAAIGQP